MPSATKSSEYIKNLVILSRSEWMEQILLAVEFDQDWHVLNMNVLKGVIKTTEVREQTTLLEAT